MAAIIAAAIGAAALIGTTAYSASQGTPDTTTTQTLEFPEETRRLFQDIEEPLLRGSLEEQASLLMPLLGGFRTRDAAAQRFGASQDIPFASARTGAKRAGVTDLGSSLEAVQGLQPELLAALRDLALARGQQLTTVVQPGYGQFLSPQTATQQSGGGTDAFQVGFQAAGGLASIAGAYYGRPGAT